MFQSFNQKKTDQSTAPMFLGEGLNVARYDIQKHPLFEYLTQTQLSFFWRPEEISLTGDVVDFNNFTAMEKHIFISNLQYQILLDSVQGRSPSIALLPIASLPELEVWIQSWTFSETIHSRSYTHIVRMLFADPSVVFDKILDNQHILDRASSISNYYDDLIRAINIYQSLGQRGNMKDIKRKLYLALHSINALEAIRFYVSFACTFGFAENSKIEGCAKIMRLIARDEQLHCTGTEHMIHLINHNLDNDSEMYYIAQTCKHEAEEIFMDVVQQEKAWAKYLFSQGEILGLNERLLSSYIDYLAYRKMKLIGLEYKGPRVRENPLLWMNKYLQSDNVQVAPQETELASYLVGQIDNKLDPDSISKWKL